MVCKDIADWPDKSLMSRSDKDTRRGDIGLFLTDCSELLVCWVERRSNIVGKKDCVGYQMAETDMITNLHTLDFVA